MGKTQRPRVSLRAFINSYPRTVKQYQIAARLGLGPDVLSRLLSGARPGPETAEKLRAHGIDPDLREL